ncbi:primosomal protein N' [Dehalobacter sp. DCM]|uniref:primosomal protein N' n=1 Tax=Dehalobacter sp. DCM TaxID=2907827 RepID=UPI0030815EF1|nr:primosomal protein N' [Dehalobacter sp. DCM]
MAGFAEVLVDVANRRLDQSFHYSIPHDMSIQAGMMVVVPLKNRKVRGLVVSTTTEPPVFDSETKFRAIEEILEENSLIPQELIQLACWLSETTICPVAQALHTVWPFLKGKAETWYFPNAALHDEEVQVLKLLDPETYNVLMFLNRARRGGLPESDLTKKTGVGNALLEEMLKQGWIKKEVRNTGASRVYYGSSETRSADIQNKKDTSPKQITVKDSLKSDISHGVIQGKSSVGTNNRSLSPAQENALDKISGFYSNREFGTVLLHGVTGSGKTEVYQELTARILDDGGDAIILVPEISLTSQIARIFTEKFGEKVAVIHSGIGATDKLALWQNVLEGKKRIIIGARSAVFAPLPNLKLIIMDEEHDNAYKQDENPKYHARDVARRRMEEKNGLVVLGSATPSLEAFAAAQTQKIGYVSLRERFNKRSLPTVEIVDMKQELAGGNKTMFSLALRNKLQDRIERGEQSILFLNRRGYSTFVFCRECGYVARCPHCDVSLTYHTHSQQLRCHYCNYQQDVFHHCPECNSRYIRFFGQGTQKVEEEVSALFPGIQVLRLDADTTAGSQRYKQILDRFRRQEAPILVGTQMLAKGLDFPNVTLVGVISADQLFNMPDFRSRERAFQLLTQVAGRAGRGSKDGEVLIQTYSPEERSILLAANQDYEAFFWEEIAYRKKQSYPPFSHIIRIMLFHEKEDRVIKAAHELAGSLRQKLGEKEREKYDLLGPAPAILTRIKNEFRWQLSVKGKNPSILRRIVHEGVHDFYRTPASSGIKLSIEADPLTS